MYFYRWVLKIVCGNFQNPPMFVLISCQRVLLLLQCLQKLNLYDAEFVLGFVSILGFEQI